jgi:trehalose 6-phosphate phosphatase
VKRDDVDSTIATHLEQAARQCAEALGHRPSGLFSDFDGTLSMIAPTPPEAVFYEGARDALDRAARCADVAGIITGRAVDDVLERVDVPGLLIVGNHGLEWFDDGHRIDHEAGVAAEAGIKRTLARTRERLESLTDIDGMLFEDKRLSASIHYRNVADPVAVGLQLLPIVEEEAAANGLRVSGGKMLVELRPTAVVSKGTALEQIVRERGLGSAIFFGDDVTDVDGFRALHRIREEGQVDTVAVAIRSPDVHPDVIAEADIVLEGVPDTVVVLHRIADLLTNGKKV